jgi:hypothetical protein
MANIARYGSQLFLISAMTVQSPFTKSKNRYTIPTVNFKSLKVFKSIHFCVLVDRKQHYFVLLKFSNSLDNINWFSFYYGHFFNEMLFLFGFKYICYSKSSSLN